MRRCASLSGMPTRRCHYVELVDKSRREGGNIEITVYQDATHDFDDPGPRRQAVEANVLASETAWRAAAAFMHNLLAKPM